MRDRLGRGGNTAARIEAILVMRCLFRTVLVEARILNIRVRFRHDHFQEEVRDVAVIAGRELGRGVALCNGVRQGRLRAFYKSRRWEAFSGRGRAGILKITFPLVPRPIFPSEGEIVGRSSARDR